MGKQHVLYIEHGLEPGIISLTPLVDQEGILEPVRYWQFVKAFPQWTDLLVILIDPTYYIYNHSALDIGFPLSPLPFNSTPPAHSLALLPSHRWASGVCPPTRRRKGSPCRWWPSAVLVVQPTCWPITRNTYLRLPAPPCPLLAAFPPAHDPGWTQTLSSEKTGLTPSYSHLSVTCRRQVTGWRNRSSPYA